MMSLFAVYIHNTRFVIYVCFFYLLPGMSESGDLVEVSVLFSQCLKEDDSVKQCTLLKKVLMVIVKCKINYGQLFDHW